MNDKLSLLRQLDRLIDEGDIDAVTRCLDALSSEEQAPIRAEEPTLFSARIMQLNQEDRPMKHSRKTMRLALAAALVAVLGVGVYAAEALHLFSFQSGDRWVTFSTNQGMTEQEAKALVEDGREESPAAPESSTFTRTPEQTFDSVAEAETAMDMALIVPPAMPDMTLESITGRSLSTEGGFRQGYVWINYTDAAGRMLGITTAREVIPPGEDITSYTEHDIDEGSLGSYRSKSGVAYTTLTDSDDTGERTAQIATVTIGEYEYSLVFYGFGEAEWKAIVDSADLTPYQSAAR